MLGGSCIDLNANYIYASDNIIHTEKFVWFIEVAYIAFAQI